MSFFAWDPSLQLNVATMDTEHQGLIAAMNKIYDAAQKNAGKAVLGQALEALVDLTRKHFAHEETLMREAKYEGYETHTYVHKDLLTKLDKHVADFQAGPGTIDAAFFSFLRMWLTAHIKGIDKKYAPVVTGYKAA